MMHLEAAQQRSFVRICIYLAVLIGTFGIYSLLDGHNIAQEEQRSNLQNEINALNNQITEATIKAAKVADAVKLWERLKKKNAIGNGLRLQEARDLINELQKEYHLINMKVSLTKPELTDASFESRFIKIEKSTVNIMFDAVSDEAVLSFIGRIIREFPGYVSVQDFSMTKLAPIDKDALASLQKGELPALVGVQVTFLWRDLKNNTAENVAQPSNNGPTP